MEKTFSTVTIGCKLNQFETEWIREALIRRSWRYRRSDEEAAFCIINSCTVTARSDARSRAAARRAKRANPRGFVVVTGCCAETERESLAGMPEVDLVLGNGEKRSLPAIIDGIADRRRGDDPGNRHAASPPAPAEPDGIERFFDRARAFVKIQEGCDASCSYCIVPRARGPSRSVPAAALLDQVAVLEANGYHEIVLCGVHIGRYGADLDPPATLSGLVEALLERAGSLRIRLSSVEMNEVTPGLLVLLRDAGRLAPHMHVPLQSGDDRILEAMNRSYRSSDFRRKIAEIAGARGALAIGTDIIVGFPGETDECFENTYALVRDLPFSYLHVFGYSPRPGTPAAAMANAVNPGVKRERIRRLIDLGAKKKRAFLESHVGTAQLALVQGPAEERVTRLRSLTGTYCEVLLPEGAGAPGTLVPIRVGRFAGGVLYGAPLAEHGSPRGPIAGECPR
jgi:threonylcarbamoyladenosine tRNA methylthiotransferase MtaB